MAITKAKKQQTIKEFGKSEKDTGTPEVQIAILTEEINQLTLHLQKSPKDLHSKRGIYRKSAQRDRLLKYLKNEDEKRYSNLVKKLNIRDKK